MRHRLTIPFMLLVTSIILATSFPAQTLADTTFKRKCPFSCKDAGVPKSHCEDSKQGDKCVVKIKNGAKGSGKYTFRKKCPLSCKSMGAKGKCKDWKEKDKCFVQM